MAAVMHAFPKASQNLALKQMDLATDALAVLLIASGTYTWNTTAQGQQYVSDFLAGSGAGALTEVSVTGTGYSRQNLTAVTLSTSGTVTALSCANPQWASASFTASYALFYDNANATDATRQILCYADFGGAQTVANTTFELAVSAPGLMTWSA